MRILFLTQIIPYPPDAGPKMKTWHVLRYLASQGHEVILASFIRPEEEPFLPKIKEVCTEIHVVPIRRNRIADVGYGIISYFTGRPFLIERDNLPSMRRLVAHILSTHKIDVIHADQLSMAQFGLVKNRPRAILFDAHNAVWTIVSRIQETSPWYLKIPLGIEARRVRRYEAMLVEKYDCTLAVTEVDKRLLAGKNHRPGAARGEDRIKVIPIAVDTAQLQPVSRQGGSFNILTLGTLHYPPNADGIRWFLHEVFPRVRQLTPGSKLIIVGKNPPLDFLEAARQNPEFLEVTGYVTDLTPYFEKAAVVIIPVRAGSGMRVRILEAFSRGMPVVTTSIGLEGIEARAGEEVLVEDTAEGFARAVANLLQNPDQQEKLAVAGRKVATSRYDWQVVLGKLGLIYQEFMH